MYVYQIAEVVVINSLKEGVMYDKNITKKTSQRRH